MYCYCLPVYWSPVKINWLLFTSGCCQCGLHCCWYCTNRHCCDLIQANVDIQLAPEQWPLEPLAIKMKQYCYLLEDLTADVLKEQAGGDFELLRKYLRRRAVEAYWQKVLALFPPSPYPYPPHPYPPLPIR